jgi:hypothetical protein
MPEVSNTLSTERRQRTRVAVEMPIRVLTVDGVEVDWSARTRNISSGGGVCFACPHPLRPGQQVGYEVTLSQGVAPVRIACSGLVVRSIPETGPESAFETAVTMVRYRFLSPNDSGA